MADDAPAPPSKADRSVRHYMLLEINSLRALVSEMEKLGADGWEIVHVGEAHGFLSVVLSRAAMDGDAAPDRVRNVAPHALSGMTATTQS